MSGRPYYAAPQRASTTVSCGSITQIFANLTIPVEEFLNPAEAAGRRAQDHQGAGWGPRV